MWHSGLKCQRIRASVNASRKRLKADLASGVRKLGPASLVSKLGEFPLFDGFLDLADFWLSDLPVFGSPRYDPSLNPSPAPPIQPTSLAASTLVPSTSLAASTCDEMIVFSIDVSSAVILQNF